MLDEEGIIKLKLIDSVRFNLIRPRNRVNYRHLGIVETDILESNMDRPFVDGVPFQDKSYLALFEHTFYPNIVFQGGIILDKDYPRIMEVGSEIYFKDRSYIQDFLNEMGDFLKAEFVLLQKYWKFTYD